MFKPARLLFSQSSSVVARARRVAFAATAVALFLAPAVSASPSTAGVFRVLPTEVALVGGESDLFAGGPRRHVDGITLGTFDFTGPIVGVSQRPPYADALWFAPASKPPLAPTGFRDGLVRFTCALGTSPDLSLLVRTDVDGANPERFTGLGFSFEKTRLVAHRWTKGLVREMGVETKAVGWTGRTVEVAITLAGAFVVAVVSDAATAEILATLAVTDVGSGSGGVGFRIAKGQSDDGGIRTVSFAPSRAPTASEKTLSGQRRMAFVEGTVPDNLPRAIRSKFVPVDDTTTAVVGSPLDLAKVRRAGVLLRGETADFGYKWLDADTRQTLLEPLPTTTKMPVGYVDSERLGALLLAYQTKFPAIAKRIKIGTTRQDRPIWALKISDHVDVDEPEPAVLLNGGHHGLELISTTVVLDAIDQILSRYGKERQVKRWVDGLEIYVIPLVNPDGADLFLHETTFGGRKNGKTVTTSPEENTSKSVDPNQGVDLNRNYPFQWGTLGEVGSRSWPAHYRYRGETPASEPETQAMIALAKRLHFASALSYHSWATRILVPYTIPGVDNRRGDEAWTVAERMAKQMPSQPSRRRFKARRLLYPVDGTDQDWFRHEIGTLALLVEVALHNPVGAKKTATVEASRASWRYILERTVRGPTLSVLAIDATGQPVLAQIEVLESLPIHGEKWMTREDGWHHRLLASPGTYRVRATAQGVAKVQRVRVGARGGRVRFEF